MNNPLKLLSRLNEGATSKICRIRQRLQTDLQFVPARAWLELQNSLQAAVDLGAFTKMGITTASTRTANSAALRSRW